MYLIQSGSSTLHDRKHKDCISKTENTEGPVYFINLPSFTRPIRRRIAEHFQRAKKQKRKISVKLVEVREHDTSRSIASCGKSSRRSATTRVSAGAIEEVVTNKVAGERIRVAESKNDGPPLVAAAVRKAHQWPRCFPLNMRAWPPALPFL